MYYVYVLRNQAGQPVYVGESINPQERWEAHTMKRPTSPGRGRFYGMQNELTMHIMASFLTRSEALDYEGELKMKYEMEWTEKTRNFQPGNQAAKKK